MVDFKKHKPFEPENRSLDGFTKRPQADGFKSIDRTSSIQDYHDYVDRVMSSENDPANFPGLRSTFQQPRAQVEAEHQYQQQETEQRPNRIINLPKFSPLKIFKRLALASTLLVLLAGGWLAFKGFLTIRNVLQDDGTTALALNRSVDPSQLNQEGDGRVNVLILGKGGEFHEGGDLTDSIILASIDPFSDTAGLLSVPRDLYVDAPGLWPMKINAVYTNAKQKAYDLGQSEAQAEVTGITAIKETVESYIGLPINYHIMVDFQAFEQAVNAVGGIEIDVESALYDTNFLPTFLLNVRPGLQTFNGQTALFYARSRYTSPRGDFDRAERQREIMVALKDKVLSVGTFANPVTISNLLDTVDDNVQTNISFDEIRQLYDIVGRIDSQNISSLSFVDDPVLVQTSYVGDQSVVIPLAGVNDYNDIKSYVRNALLDGFLNRESATVTVLNGSGVIGGATRKSQELKSYGYNVVEVANAPTQDYAKTTLVANNKDNPYTKSYLERRLDVSAVNGINGLEQYTSDFVIIIGANEGFSL